MDRNFDGLVAITGPDVFRFDELIRERLAAENDPRTLVTDAHIGEILP